MGKNLSQLSRRQFIRTAGVGAAAVGAAAYGFGHVASAEPVPGGTLEPDDVPKYVTPLVIPPAMPRTEKISMKKGRNIDYYEIAVRQFNQQILPPMDKDGYPLPATTVWSYGSINHPSTFNYPAFTIEAKYKTPLRVKWINDLRYWDGEKWCYLPHLLPVDQTLHWCNPPGGEAMRDMRGNNPNPYIGPVPIVTHVHGAHTYEESDGYPEAWYLPDADDIPGTYATEGTMYLQFMDEFNTRYKDLPLTKKQDNLGLIWQPGSSTYQYPNDQRATTLWYHDHGLGITRLNVYAGPAGFYLLRGGPDDMVSDSATMLPATLPGPAPALGDPPGLTYYEIPIAIQDRSFNADGSLYFPDNRAFFEELEPEQLQINFIPEYGCDDKPSDVSPIWNPEFFGNMMVVNGNTWPFLEVEQKRYRFRLLNGCNSRFLILDFNSIPGAQVWQIGSDGGFLPAPIDINTLPAPNNGRLLIAPAERMDIILDFAQVPVGSHVLTNLGPDEPFGGGFPGIEFMSADPESTGQVMQFRVSPAIGPDMSTPPEQLVLPALMPLFPESSRKVSLNEEESESVRVIEDEDGNVIMDCLDPLAEPFGPIAAKVGTVDEYGNGIPLRWMDPITENPDLGATEEWEIYNFTMDAHPIHVHLVQFQVVGRELIGGGLSIAGSNEPLANETGFKDTVIAYPGEITRIKARFDYEGLYVWHCHIIDHEDNEMMRPYYVGTMP